MKLLFSIVTSEIMKVIVQIVAEVFKALIDCLWKHLPTMLVVG